MICAAQLCIQTEFELTAKARFTQADLTRVFQSAKSAGFTSFKIVIDITGVITIEVPPGEEDEREESLADYFDRPLGYGTRNR